MPMVFNEILGREVNVPDDPRRIISFSPAVTEALFMIGMGDAVVGVTPFCVRPAEARSKRKVGSYNTVSEETLRTVDPDLIFAVTGYQRAFAVALSEKRPVYPFELPVSVAGIIDMVVKLGLVVGREREGRKAASTLLSNLSRVRPVAKAMNVYVEMDLGGPVSFGAYSYITDAIAMLGCTTPYAEARAEWLTPDFGDVIRRGPEVMIYEAKMFSKFTEADLEKALRSRGWWGAEFTKPRHLLLAPGPFDFLAHHGPSFVTEALPWLEKSLAAAAT
jgi:iron complex transport system substrate-binding protein